MSELPPLPKPNDPPVFGYTSADMRAYAKLAFAAGAAAEREACAKVLRDAAERLAPSGKRTNMADRHTAEILSHYADAIRDRGNQPGGAHG